MLLAELENYVKDYILVGEAHDMVLNEYISLVLNAATTQTEIFPASLGLLGRPAFFERYLRHWITEGMEELRKTRST